MKRIAKEIQRFAVRHEPVFVQTHLLDKFLRALMSLSLPVGSVSEKAVAFPQRCRGVVLSGAEIDKFCPDGRCDDSGCDAVETPDAASNASRVLWTTPLTLVTHNSDFSAPFEPGDPRGVPWRRSGRMLRSTGAAIEKYAYHRRVVLDRPQYFSAWFAQNTAIRHPKLIPIPIGLENRYNRYGVHVDLYDEAARLAPRWEHRAQKLFVGFSLKTNPVERQQALRAARALPPHLVTFYSVSPSSIRPNASVRKGGLDGGKTAVERWKLWRMLRAMGKHRFVLAPRGHGLDTHRMWEALYLNCLPIVRRHPPFEGDVLQTLPIRWVKAYTPQALQNAMEQAPRNRVVRSVEQELPLPLNMSYWRKRLWSRVG